MIYCTDVDLLFWEPNIFRDAAFASQTLLAGTGDLAGTSFTLDTGSLTAGHVAVNHVITLAGAMPGSFPIVSVNSAVNLTLSVLYDGLFPETGSPVPSGPGTAIDLPYTIRTFWPQRKLASDRILRDMGIGTTADSPPASAILNPQALVTLCALGTLLQIYQAMSFTEESFEQRQRVEFYQDEYEKALLKTKLELDTNGDGVADLMWTTRPVVPERR